MTSSYRLTKSLNEQIARVGQRDPQAEAKIRSAVAAVPDLVSHLGLDGFVGVLVKDDKPRLLLRFERCRVPGLDEVASDVVLKVYGDRPRGEGPLLKEWGRRGVSVPRLETGTTADCSWLLMEHLSHTPIDVTYQECLMATDVLAGWGAAMHEPVPHLADVLRPLGDTMLPRWEACASALRADGRSVPLAWHSAAGLHYGGGGLAPLHGDLTFGNIARRPDGTLVLFDASALLGPKMFDAARWSARLAVAAMPPQDVFTRWSNAETDGAPGAYELLGVECVLEAGSLVVMRSQRHPASPALWRTDPSGNIDAAIDNLLHTARSILG
ncbi:hypothetical protein GCM10010156_16040 [Planobispora rosea]|uniref:Uncharacterized protein n=1 Tax=Planobispora rosea TaxID=35762 RepID=A0A8J3RZN4_PLARO|nr:hypothetical protein [Planobispora rosea]GGS58209.1 hypothetical protein GCM10010156_16040 [Planobispora rosea]GIH84787.1 hypothetical protein Pro02_31950 [Planobispora rosea]